MGVILLLIAGAIFIYWLAGSGAPVAQKPAIFRTSFGPMLILAVAVILAILGFVAL